MKTKMRAILVLFGFALMSNLAAQDDYKMLQQKVDSLEAKLEKIYAEQFEINPYASGEALNWGTGFFGSAKAGSHYTMNLELGYMFGISKNPLAFFSRDYIGDRKDYRFGVSTGMQMFVDEPVYKNDVEFYKSTGYAPYLKVNFGSPVLFNFISFSWHLKAMYAIPTDDNDHTITDGRMAFGYGNDIEFWVTENSSVTIGFTDECDTFFGTNEIDPIYPSKIRFVFGFKTFF